MAVPDFQSVMLPFLETLQDGKERTMRELTEQLALGFKLTEEERRNIYQAARNRCSTIAELMIEHNLGVTRTKTYELKEVSNDFFDESEL